MEKRCWVKTCCLCFGWLARNDYSKCKRNNIHMLIILLISMLEIRAFDSYTCFLDELHTNASFKTRWPKKKVIIRLCLLNVYRLYCFFTVFAY